MNGAYDEWLRLATLKEDHTAFYVEESRKGYINDELMPFLEDFNQKVWQKDLFDWVDKANRVSHLAKFDDTVFLIFYTCGRVMMTFNQGDNVQVTVIADANNKNGMKMGFQSFCGSIFDLRDALVSVTKNWDIKKLEGSKTIGIG